MTIAISWDDLSFNQETHVEFAPDHHGIAIEEIHRTLNGGEDEIFFSIERGSVESTIVDFVLESDPGIRWWKGLIVPDGLSSSWEISTVDDKMSESVALWADQIYNGQVLTFKKAKFLGVHTEMYTLGNLPAKLQPGDRVIFRWLKD